MADLFGMLYGNLQPKRKLLTTATSNMVDGLRQLLQQEPSLDLNERLLEQNGNTALHIAAQSGFCQYIATLLEAGANADVMNNFGYTPLHLALRQGEVKCVKLILKQGTLRTDPLPIWHSQQMDGLHTWIGYSSDMLVLMLIATPNFRTLNLESRQEFFVRKIREAESEKLVKIFIETGSLCSPEQLKQLISNCSDSLKEWIRGSMSVQKLQHYARLAVRRHLRPNVLHCSDKLPLPQKLQQYLVFEDD